MTATSYEVRAELESLLERDLLGPWDGPAHGPAVVPGDHNELEVILKQWVGITIMIEWEVGTTAT